MKTTAAALVGLSAIAPILAQDVDRDDIPSQCQIVCSNIAVVSEECDRAFRRDRDERDCMCQAENAREVVPLCAACIEFYDSDDDDDSDSDDDEDNDAGELRRGCGFSSITYNPSSQYIVPQMTAATTISSGTASTTSPTATSNQGQLTSALNSISSELATATTTDSASLSSVISSVSSQVGGQASAASDNSNAGVKRDDPPAALAGAALLAAAAFL
ncbi:uncharacterized protein HMPREF1541_07723 [Cyphellophora europaea CBS 101466]|uniref:Extracellular membrane protein CFEM domain-containing protein n=1 Tax=Cyphellophora europaea (strain CBS 101466) TaxID=1220924 RepID=W2RQU5_CYPE1|nr:uncharacterized protein HMPREF1541_07723 [Cyphellophora europaea CBS 101466]ETN38099.1 hypothetical protein HMPREF1541_07723 [Cyphellophora europaea CBS 101466]